MYNLHKMVKETVLKNTKLFNKREIDFLIKIETDNFLTRVKNKIKGDRILIKSLSEGVPKKYMNKKTKQYSKLLDSIERKIKEMEPGLTRAGPHIGESGG